MLYFHKLGSLCQNYRKQIVAAWNPVNYILLFNNQSNWPTYRPNLNAKPCFNQTIIAVNSLVHSFLILRLSFEVLLKERLHSQKNVLYIAQQQNSNNRRRSFVITKLSNNEFVNFWQVFCLLLRLNHFLSFFVRVPSKSQSLSYRHLCERRIVWEVYRRSFDRRWWFGSQPSG